MLPINFLYDKPVSDKPGHQYHYNYYDKKYYPTNGNFNNCYYDYHAPLQTVVEQNGVSTCSIVLEDILNTATPCIYVLTYRFFADVIIFNKDKQLLTGVNQEIIDMVKRER